MKRVLSGARGEFRPEHFLVIPDVALDGNVHESRVRRAIKLSILLESLILAQDERWRRA